MPELAVLLPVFNNQKGLLRSLDSLRAETIEFDIIIVDDGSTEPLNLPESEIHKTIVLRQEPNQGIERALNRGLEFIMEKNYTFIARLDAGDTCINNRLDKQLSFLQKHPSYMLVGAYADYVNTEGDTIFTHRVPITPHAISKAIYFNNCFCHPAVMFRTQAVRDLGMYSYDYPAAEDYEYFFRFVRRYSTANIAEVLIQTEANPQGISRKKRKQQLHSRWRIQQKAFSFLNIYSLLGLLKTLILWLLPNTFIVSVKKYLWPS